MIQGWSDQLQQNRWVRAILISLKTATASSESSGNLANLSYQNWRYRFLKARLQLALLVLVLLLFSFIPLNLIRWLLGRDPNMHYWLLTTLATEVSLAICLGLLHTPLGRRHLGLIFLMVSAAITIIDQIVNTARDTLTLNLTMWMMVFFTQATLIPVRWPLHLISQLITVTYYLGVQVILRDEPFPAMAISSLLLLFWVCFICNFSVYLYERLQQAEFNTRRQLESAYRELELAGEKYRSIYENSLEGIYQITTDGRYLSANPALASIYGYLSAQDLITRLTDINHQLYVDPSRRAEFVRLMKEQGVVLAFESQVYQADGNIIWISETARAIHDAAGVIIAYEGNVVDITERKQAEAEIHKNLEKEKELNQLKSGFVSMISHEFRTPLTTILASSEALEHYHYKWSEEKKRTYLHLIQTSVKHMTNLLNDVLLIDKVEANKLQFNPADLNLEIFCRNLIEEMQLSGESRHTFILEIQGTQQKLENLSSREILTNTGGDSVNSLVSSGLCSMDERLLRHIFTNLLSNSIKYSPEGGRIYFKLTYQDDQAIFEIQDEGIGIPPEDQPHLFDSFHRGTNVGTLPGTGLGLAIVNKSVEVHGGQITVNSKVGVGTTFRVTLPLNFKGIETHGENSSD